MSTALAPRQAAFVREYLVRGNATQSAIAAGYSETSASTMGCALLKNPQVQAELQAARMRMARERDVTEARIVEEWRRIAFSDARSVFGADGNLLLPHQWDDDTASSIAGLEVGRTRVLGGTGEGAGPAIEESVLKVKRHDKLKALDRLAEVAGVISGPGGTGTGTRKPAAAPLDASVLARMEDADLDAALGIVERIEQAGGG